jgi:epoxyqueuosine reductase
MKERIRRQARELGFEECHFTTAETPRSAPHFQRWLAGQNHGEMAYLQRNAEKRLDPQRVLPGASTIIVLMASYAREENTLGEGVSPVAATTPGVSTGVIARYARFRDYHDVLKVPLTRLAGFLNELGGPEVRSLWYVDTGPLLERDLAQRSGAGFIGKHTNLISRRLGNWTFLSEILTTLPLEPDPPEHNRCGSCTRCLAACPTGAITAPFELDARKCISYLTIELKGPIPTFLRPAIGTRIYGCDDCLAVCPWNRFARSGALMRDQARADLQAPDLIELLELDEAGFKQRFAGTPILRTKRRGLLRNVCVALGNLKEARAVPVLQRAARDPEPLIAEHARWALEQILEPKSS